jgi:ketosteroid isomerase-like protein
MSQESPTPDLVELSRRAFEASNRRNYDEAVAPYSPHAVWDMSRVGMGVFEGREAIRRFFDDWIGAYEEWDTAIEEFHDLDNGVTEE